MFNLHPVFAHFPFVLLLIAAIVELLVVLGKKDLSKFASWLLLTACIVSPLTYLSGYIGLEYANKTFEVPTEAISAHQIIGKIYLLVLVPTALLYLLKEEAESRAVAIAARIFLVVSLAIASLASFYGGRLVFSHGAGVATEDLTSSE